MEMKKSALFFLCFMATLLFAVITANSGPEKKIVEQLNREQLNASTEAGV